MRFRTLSRNRATSLGLAAVLVGAGALTFAPASQAAISLKATPASGSTAGGSVVTLTGKGIQNAAGTTQIGNVELTTGTCAATAAGNTGVVQTGVNVVSETKAVVTTLTTALTAGKKNLCVYNVAGTSLFGSAAYTLVTPATFTSVTPATGPSFGGSKVVVSGENFTSKTTIKVGGKAITGAKVTINASADDTVAGLLPAGTGVKDVVITTEAGATTSAAAFTYVSALKVSPTFGNGTAANVIEVSGQDFSSLTFGTAANEYQLGLVPGGTSVAAAAAIPTVLCGTVQRVDDDLLYCQLPSLTGALGAYTVVLFQDDGTGSIVSASAISKSATYTVAPF